MAGFLVEKPLERHLAGFEPKSIQLLPYCISFEWKNLRSKEEIHWDWLVEGRVGQEITEYEFKAFPQSLIGTLPRCLTHASRTSSPRPSSSNGSSGNDVESSTLAPLAPSISLLQHDTHGGTVARPPGPLTSQTETRSPLWLCLPPTSRPQPKRKVLWMVHSQVKPCHGSVGQARKCWGMPDWWLEADVSHIELLNKWNHLP